MVFHYTKHVITIPDEQFARFWKTVLNNRFAAQISSLRGQDESDIREALKFYIHEAQDDPMFDAGKIKRMKSLLEVFGGEI